MRAIFTCGGTAGHINPAIAVAKLIIERQPSSEILFVGADGGMENNLVPREGFAIETVKMASWARKPTPSSLVHNVRMLSIRRQSIHRAEDIIQKFKPDIVVGTGGYASYPAIRAAQRLGIPTALHESNVKPGLTTTVLARQASLVMLGFEDGKKHYSKGTRLAVTGTPVREEFIFKSKKDAKRELGFTDAPLVVSFWGSLGAREMNKKIAQFIQLETKQDNFYHIHATGSYGWKWMPESVSQLGVDLKAHPRVDMREYIFNMPIVMAAADIVICRAGASTLGEVIASATPAIVVPSPNVAGNHQEFNARALERAGGAEVILESDASGELLYKKVNELLANPDKLESMSDSLRKMALLDSTQRIYDEIRELVNK